MNVFGNKGLGNLLKIILQVASVIGIVFLLVMYFIVKKLGLHFDLFIMMIYPCGLVFLMLVNHFIGLFNSLKLNTPFIIDNVMRLRKSMACCFALGLLIFIALMIAIFLFSYYRMQLKVILGFVSLLFFGAGIALYILAELFKQATEYKEENDLTI